MNRRSRHLRLKLVALLTTAGLCACTGSGTSNGSDGEASGRNPNSGSQKSLFADSPVTVLVKSDQPGFSTPSGGESYTGFDVALTHFLAREIGFKERLRSVPGGEREQSLSRGLGDLAIATYTITEARDEKIDFTAPYLKTYQGVLVRKDNTDIKKLDDVAGKRVCTATGTTSDPGSAPGRGEREQIVDAIGRDAVIKLRKDYDSCVSALRTGVVDAVWTDKVLLEGIAEADGGHDVKVVEDIAIESRQFYGIGLPEGHERDCRRINARLKKFLRQTWRDTFTDHFPRIAAGGPGFEQQYKPTEREFKAYEAKSCGGA
ncbi:transporter substrate-binding domain-containing protein [Streptomyces bathyalis]|uniref:Transporter substrate-binding domain-containing protein n=1 Tax=Streptomyces bathyalis TaxID=2710756 RepID=A0A7T1T6V5_9ACTN|nr:transporter substrate-binding domain-containing protein [Streptomyces bathyalis]QPP07486.1 transporter substrate-binding domain-containing protein [Streptomyces bathyalis]